MERAYDPSGNADLDQPIRLDKPMELGYGQLASERDIFASRSDFAGLNTEWQVPLEWRAMQVKAVLPAFVCALPSPSSGSALPTLATMPQAARHTKIASTRA